MPETVESGRLFEWNALNAWVEKPLEINSQTAIRSMVVFDDKIYGSTETLDDEIMKS